MHRGTSRKLALLLGLAVFAVYAGGCKKQVAAPPPAPAPAPPPAKPTVTLNASPDTITSGQSSTLAWSSTDATDLDIEPTVGKVSPTGSTQVSPTDTATYTITATGAGGSATATASVTVSAPPPPPTPAPQPSISDLFAQNVKDAFFDFEKSDVRADARDVLTKDAAFLQSYPDVKITIEGHCDERGSEEYNLGLGQRRADAAKNFLVSLGISADRISTVSYGKERPFCTDHDEDCWQQNRRAHFVMAQ